jgi:hypothetical protein
MIQENRGSIVTRLRAQLRLRTRLRTVRSHLKPRLRIACYNLGYRMIRGHDGRPLPPASLVSARRHVHAAGDLYLPATTRRARRVVRVHARLRLRSWPHPALVGGIGDRCEIWGCDYNPRLVAWCREGGVRGTSDMYLYRKVSTPPA